MYRGRLTNINSMWEADKRIRDAVQLIWSLTKQDSPTQDRIVFLEENMHRITKRALSDLKEDVKALNDDHTDLWANN